MDDCRRSVVFAAPARGLLLDTGLSYVRQGKFAHTVRVQDAQSHCTAEYSVSLAVPGPPLTTGTAALMSVRHTVMTRARLWG